jgi:hypothetical protein
MKRIVGVIGTAAIAVTLTASPAMAHPDKKPNPATKRACEDFIDFSVETGTGISALTVKQARTLVRAFDKKGVPKSLKRAAHTWFGNVPEAVARGLPLADQQEIDLLEACERAGVRR